VLTHEFHQEFMKMSGLLQALHASEKCLEDGHRYTLKTRSRYRSAFIEGELNHLICKALIELGASAVVVLSEDTALSGLESIPEVRAAVRDAWLSLESLEQQIEAIARGEDLPTWPVLIQRELHPGTSNL